MTIYQFELTRPDAQYIAAFTQRREHDEPILMVSFKTFPSKKASMLYMSTPV